MRTRARRSAIAALFGVLAVAGIGCVVQPAATHDSATIPPEELRSYPPILVRWGETQHATHTATGDVYVVQPDGSGVRRLLSWPDRVKDGQVYGAAAAAWSPRRRQVGLLLGWWCGDPCFTLARVAAAGGPVRKLKVPADVFHAHWSSDWRALLTTFGGTDLWTIPMSGGKAVRIWHSSGGGGFAAADWSPNGRHVVVSTSRGLVRMTRAGKQLVRVTRVGRDGEPQWSPKGDEIAFVRQPRCFWEPDCSDPAHLYVIGSDGRKLRRVASADFLVSFLWSRDAKAIVFATDLSTERVTRRDIEIVGADGRDRRTLSSGAADDPTAWSRDGRKILFMREQTRQQGGGTDLWVMDADGGRPTRLLSRPGWTVLSADWGA
jgi:Tol biopolymer transport system component